MHAVQFFGTFFLVSGIFALFHLTHKHKLKFSGAGLRRVSVPQINYRNDFGFLMEELGGQTMIEIGVEKGLFAKTIIENWKTLRKYYGIDPWKNQRVNFERKTKRDKSTHEAFYRETVKRLTGYGNRVEIIRGFSTQEAFRFDDESIDFIYLDGRHDYCGCYDDLEVFWPKLRKGGIMAGHDYVNADQTNSDWRCANGTLIDGAVIKAVKDFRTKHGIKKLWVIQEIGNRPSFYFQKPFD